MTLEELTALFERGLEKWPDGVAAICAVSGLPYEVFGLGYLVNGTMRDRDVIEKMVEFVTALKVERNAKFISWRKPLEWQEETIGPMDMIMTRDNEATWRAPLLNVRRRVLRCRVLITATPADPDWVKTDTVSNALDYIQRHK